MTDRDRLIELCNQKINTMEFNNSDHWFDFHERMSEIADYLLANGVIVQKQGYWNDNCNGTFTCSVCGGKSSKMKYCGNCGAEIDNKVARCHNCKHWIYFADEKRCVCVINHIYSERDYFCGKWESEVHQNAR